LFDGKVTSITQKHSGMVIITQKLILLVFPLW